MGFSDTSKGQGGSGTNIGIPTGSLHARRSGARCSAEPVSWKTGSGHGIWQPQRHGKQAACESVAMPLNHVVCSSPGKAPLFLERKDVSRAGEAAEAGVCKSAPVSTWLCALLLQPPPHPPGCSTRWGHHTCHHLRHMRCSLSAHLA